MRRQIKITINSDCALTVDRPAGVVARALSKFLNDLDFGHALTTGRVEGDVITLDLDSRDIEALDALSKTRRTNP